MNFTTPVIIDKLPFTLMPGEGLLFVGSCFAENISRLAVDDQFQVTANPYGTMYNPVSIAHTVERVEKIPRVVFLTLGTNHVYVDRGTGLIVDNCEKRPAREFQERCLSVKECAEALGRVVEDICRRQPEAWVVITVSPIRYAKYGFHGSMLSKATLLLAADEVCSRYERAIYFPAYEIVNDELRDYRFYAPDMIHTSAQTAEYIYGRLADACFSDQLRAFLREWHSVRAALAHRPLHPESEEYKKFAADTECRLQTLKEKYPFVKC